MTLVYRDMTWCNYDDCSDMTCRRRLTQAVEQAAELLRLPICQFVEQPDCFKGKKYAE